MVGTPFHGTRGGVGVTREVRVAVTDSVWGRIVCLARRHDSTPALIATSCVTTGLDRMVQRDAIDTDGWPSIHARLVYLHGLGLTTREMSIRTGLVQAMIRRHLYQAGLTPHPHHERY